MTTSVPLLVAFVLAVSLLPASMADVGSRSVMYYTSWGTYARNYQIASVDGSKFTHLNYAFANVVNGLCVVGDMYADVQKTFPGDTWDQPIAGNFNQLRKLKAKYPNLKTLLSIGGWTWSSDFPAATATAAARTAFVASCVSMMKQYWFDGLDVDWEYPTAATSAAFTATMQEFRKQLNAQAAADGVSKYELTIAAPAGDANYKLINWPALNGVVDYVNVMTYDFHGGWDLSRTAHNAPIFANPADPTTDLDSKNNWNVDSALRGIIALGYDASHIVMGLPFYGRGWSGVKPGPNGNGLYQPATGVPMGTWEAGVFDYKDLLNNYINNPSYKVYRDSVSRAVYMYSSATGIWISYDDVQSVNDKCSLASTLNIAGLMAWDLSSDNGDLLNAVQSCLKGSVVATSPSSVAAVKPTSIAAAKPTSVASPAKTSVAAAKPTSVASPAKTSVAAAKPTSVASPAKTSAAASPLKTSAAASPAKTSAAAAAPVGGCNTACGAGIYHSTGTCTNVPLLGGQRCQCAIGWSGPNALFLKGQLYADSCNTACYWTAATQSAQCGFTPSCTGSRREAESDHDDMSAAESSDGSGFMVLGVACVAAAVAMVGVAVYVQQKRQRAAATMLPIHSM